MALLAAWVVLGTSWVRAQEVTPAGDEADSTEMFYDATSSAAVAPMASASDTVTIPKVVWAHTMQGFPPRKFAGDGSYMYGEANTGETYPLYMIDSSNGQTLAQQTLTTAKSCGFTGMMVNVFNNATNISNYLAAADTVGGISVAPIFDPSTSTNKQTDMTNAINSYVTTYAPAHPNSAAKVTVNGVSRYLIFIWGTEQLSRSAWQAVRSPQNANVYLVTNIDWGNIMLAGTFPTAALETYFTDNYPTSANGIAPFDGGYFFRGDAGEPGGQEAQFFQSANDFFAARYRTFMGGGWPGYFRFGAGYNDAETTLIYRQNWYRNINASPALPAVTMTTWNDYDENTILDPNCTWNYTRADMTNWYAKKYLTGGATMPFPNEERLYVTTPKAIYRNQDYLAEALVINCTTATNTEVLLQLFDGNGVQVGTNVVGAVGSKNLGTATQTIHLIAFPPGRYLRAVATLRYTGGATIKTVTSAPILVLDEIIQPWVPLMYYSLRSDKARLANNQPGLSFTQSPVNLPQGQTTTASITNYGADVKFTEVIHNTMQEGNVYESPNVGVAVPQTKSDGNYKAYTDFGFYLSRVIDNSYVTGYSNPVYYAPIGDATVTENYTFNEGSGTMSHDQSTYKNVATLGISGLWSTGIVGPGTYLHFTGASNNTVLLPYYLTPAVPFEISARVYLSGTPTSSYAIYNDTGGVLFYINSNRQVFLKMQTSSGSAQATSGGQLTVGSWATVYGRWDGYQLHAWIANVGAEGTASWTGAYTSAKRSIGYNAFGSGSSFFNGYLDDVKITLYPKDKIVEQYSFQEGRGTVAYDDSIYRKTGTVNNGTWVSHNQGDNGYALSFNGTSSSVSLANGGTPTGKFTIEAKIAPTANGGVIYDDVGGVLFGLDSAGRLIFKMHQADNTWPTATSTAIISQTGWTTVKGEYTGSQLKVYINGTPNGTTPSCTASMTSGVRAIGCNPWNGSGYFPGSIDDVIIKDLDLD